MKTYKELTTEIRKLVIERYQSGGNPKLFAKSLELHPDLAYQVLYEAGLVKAREYVPNYKSRCTEWKQAVAEYYMEPHTRFETKDFFHTSDTIVDRVIEEFNLPKRTQTEELRIAHTHTFGSHEAYVEHMTQKQKQTCSSRYGVDNFAKSPLFVERVEATCTERYGTKNPMQVPFVKQRLIQTVHKLYGADWYVQTKECRARYGTTSGPNRKFANELYAANIEYETEFSLESFTYDFKVGNVLVEINPTITHNVTFEPFAKRLTTDYHYRKVTNAHKYGYECLLVWDWDLVENVIAVLQHGPVIKSDNTIVTNFSNCFHLKYIQAGYQLIDVKPQIFYVSMITGEVHDTLPPGATLGVHDYVIVHGAGIATYKQVDQN